MNNVIDQEFIFTYIPVIWFRTYHKILELMICYGERKVLKPNCKCSGNGDVVHECYNLFHSAVAAYKLDKKEEGQTIINHIDSLLEGYDSAESFTITLNGKIYLFTKDDIKLIEELTPETPISLYNEVTYSELVLLKENNKLIPGANYRLIDYSTEVRKIKKEEGYSGQTNKIVAKNTNNLFDLLLRAISENELDANATAVQSLRDTNGYFMNSRLQDWIVKYDINNNSNKYDWAEPTNGKGVIYYLKDEFGNEAPYDFKNIIFNIDDDWVYTFNYKSAEGNIDSSLMYSKNNKVFEYVLDKMYLPYNVITDDLKHSTNVTFAANSHNNVVRNVANALIREYASENKIVNSDNVVIGIDCNNITINKINEVNIGNRCYNLQLIADFIYTGTKSYVIAVPEMHDMTFRLGEELENGFIIKHEEKVTVTDETTSETEPEPEPESEPEEIVNTEETTETETN